MLAVTQLSGFGVGGADGNDNYTKILIHPDGADASTTFTDRNAGGSAHTWTPAGNAQVDTGIAKFTAAMLFDGTGDFITTPDHADFTLGSNNFTVDCWFNRAGGDATTRVICGQGNSAGNAGLAVYVILNVSNVITFNVSADGTTATTVTSSSTFTATGWHHVACVRTGNTLRLFIDGTQEGGDVSFSSAVNDSANAFGIGCLGELTVAAFNGSIAEFRLSVGIARWTAAFTPPTAPYS